MTLMLLAGMVQEAEHAGPLSAFEVNFGLFIWTWAVFLLLLWLLKKFAFPAILRVTEEREQAIQRQLGEAEKANTEAKSFSRRTGVSWLRPGPRRRRSSPRRKPRPK